MFKKLFGAPDKKKQAAPEINPIETMQKLKEQIEVVDRRVKKLDVDMKAHNAAALQKKKAGDQRGKSPDSKIHSTRRQIPAIKQSLSILNSK